MMDVFNNEATGTEPPKEELVPGALKQTPSEPYISQIWLADWNDPFSTVIE